MRALKLLREAKRRSSAVVEIANRLGSLRLESSLAGAETAQSVLTEDYLTETRARIFGYRIGDGMRSGAKLLKKKLALEKIANYYPTTPMQIDPFFEDPKIEK